MDQKPTASGQASSRLVKALHPTISTSLKDAIEAHQWSEVAVIVDSYKEQNPKHKALIEGALRLAADITPERVGGSWNQGDQDTVQIEAVGALLQSEPNKPSDILVKQVFERLCEVRAHETHTRPACKDILKTCEKVLLEASEIYPAVAFSVRQQLVAASEANGWTAAFHMEAQATAATNFFSAPEENQEGSQKKMASQLERKGPAKS